MRILIDGADMTEFVDGIKDVSITHQKKDGENKSSKKFTKELTFFGDAYDHMKPILIDSPFGKNNFCSVKIYDTCCKDDDGNEFLVFEGAVRGDTIDWCEGDCFFKGTCIEHTEATKKIDCLKTTLIWDNWNGFMSKAHPRMTYCDELRPNWLHHVVIILGILSTFTLYILTPIVAVISVIVTAVCFLVDLFGGDCPDELEDGILDDYINFINLFKQNILGCGRQHPSPLVRDYISNVCDKCGIPWSSTVYKNPTSDYYNTVYMYAPVEKGTRDTSVKMIEKNLPNHTLETFLEQLKAGPLNLDWNVKNGVLYIERKDFFWTNVSWIDTNNIDLDGQICYKWRDEEKPAFADLAYTEDPVDQCGNEAKERYWEIIEWNVPFNELQKGKLEARFPFGMSRWRKDGIDPDVIGAYSGAPFFSGVIAQYNDALIMQSGVCFQPKLLIWDGSSLVSSFVKKFFIAGSPILPGQNYNAPYHMDEYGVATNTMYPTTQPFMSAYGRFWSIENPKTNPDKGKNFNFTFNFTCDQLQDFDIFKNVDLSEGSGRIDEVTFTYGEKRQCKVTGKV